MRAAIAGAAILLMALAARLEQNRSRPRR